MQWNDPFELDPYQWEGVEFIRKNKRAFIPLPVGAGKTCIPLKASQEMDVKTITVLCMGNSLHTWKKEMQKFRPDLADRMIIIEHMSASERYKVWNDPYWKVIIAKVATFRLDYDHIHTGPTMLIGDECQKYLRNRKSPTSKCIIEYCQHIPNVVFTTGTGVSRGRQDFYPALQALRLKRFKSYWRFVNTFTFVTRTPFGFDIGGARNTQQFRNETADTILRLSQPITGLPEIIRQPFPVEMTPVQAKMYRGMADDMYLFLEQGGLVAASNTLVQLTRLRQLLICPKIIDPNCKSYGGGIEGILDHMDEEEDRRHSVIFTPFTDAIPYISEAFKAKGYGKQIIFQRGMDSNDLINAENYFRGNPDSIAIVSLMFAQSFELETGNPAYFLGYSFDPTDNEQGEGRLRRKTTSRKYVNAYYTQNLGTYDEKMLDIVNRKTLNTRIDVNDMHALNKVFGRESEQEQP